ncbi:unnamed protein product, partial [Cyprideis torosa]
MRIAQRSRTPSVKQAAASATPASYNRIYSASQSLEKRALTLRIAQWSRTPCVKQAAANATQASFNRSSSAS